jgi:hypothetical protein
MCWPRRAAQRSPRSTSLAALRDELVLPALAARERALRSNFLSCLALTARNGFARDVEPFLALCRETWGEEQLWAAARDLPHGRARQEGPAPRLAAEPFGFERPALRTRLSTRRRRATRRGCGGCLRGARSLS